MAHAPATCPARPHAGYTLAETHGRLPTSSFGRVVFWDETLALSPAEARQVLRHELAHVRQGHTYDRLLLELLRAALWFNPFVHLCGRALALTHEYLADEAALHDDASPRSFPFHFLLPTAGPASGQPPRFLGSACALLLPFPNPTVALP